MTPTKRTLLLLHAPSIVLCVLLIGRLFATENFETHPANFDFGPKYGVKERSDDDNGFVYESNIAFEPEFNSFGHCLQGALASFFSFPAVAGYLCRKLTTSIGGKFMTNRAITLLQLICLTSALMTFYPTYNLFKRIVKSGRTLATTSYVNNGSEWAMGYVIGVSVGLLLTNLIRRQLLVVLPKTHDGGAIELAKQFEIVPVSGNDDDVEDGVKRSDHIVVLDTRGGEHHLSNSAKFGFGKPEEYQSAVESETIIQVTKAISNVALAVYGLSTLLCCIFMAVSWNKCKKEDLDTCVNSETNGVEIEVGILLLLFLGMYSVVLGLFYFLCKRLYGKK